MANEEHLIILRQGIKAWNKWRKKLDIRPDLLEAMLVGVNLSKADLHGTDLSRANLHWANLQGANLKLASLEGALLDEARLSGADLRTAWMVDADLTGAYVNGANLSNAYLARANLSKADLRDADLRDADLSWANLSGANLSGANLSGADLEGAVLVKTNLTQANLSGCHIFGISAWKLELEGTIQSDLVITEKNEPVITVDNLEIAQFVYLLLRNEKLRDVISTIGRKGVLILGRFNIPERKAILDAMREELRQKGFLPIVFDFDKAVEKDFTETIKILAGLSLFVIADITNPRSSPLELQATVPDYMIPFVPIIQQGEPPFSMFADLQHKFHWVLEVRAYDTKDNLIEKLESAIIKPALEKHNELIALKNSELSIRNIDEFK